MTSIFEPEFDSEQDGDGFTYRRARIGWQVGSERLGASLYEVPPGQGTFPYHWHSANEEMLIVLSGRPSLRGRRMAGASSRRARSSRFESAPMAPTRSSTEAARPFAS